MLKNECRLYLIAIFAMKSSLGYAESNRPIPSPPEIRNPQQHESGSANQPSEPEKSSPKDTLSPIKNVISGNTNQESAKNEDKTDNKASSDWWMVWLTAILAFIGFLQLIIFSVQAWMLKRTIETMDRVGRDQSRDMRIPLP